MSVTARVDIHRPSAPEFDPEAYVLVGVYDLADCEPRGGAQAFGKAVEGLGKAGIEQAEHITFGCGHCGQTGLRYVALMYREDYQGCGWIIVGQDCLSNRFQNMTAAQFRAIQKKAAQSRAAQKLLAAFTALCEQYPVLAWATYTDNIDLGIERDLVDLQGVKVLGRDQQFLGTFPEDHRMSAGLAWGSGVMHDIARKARQYGSVSERQVALIERILGEQELKIAAYRDKLAERDVQTAQAVPVVTGRRVVEGVAVKFDEKLNDFGTRYVMTVALDDGTRVWGTVPAALAHAEAGDRVRFTATVERAPWADDISFGTFSRPTKASVVEA